MRRLIRAAAAIALPVLVVACASSPGPTPPAPASRASPASAGPSVAPAASASAGVPASAPAVSPGPASSPAVTSSPTGATASSSPTPEASMPAFTLTSTAFAAGDHIPRRFTCDGENVSPELAWTDAPDGTKALVLLVDDPDARGWVHWIVLDMAGTSSGALPHGVGASPDAPAQGRNDFGRVGWGGPCPPSGTHRYTFTLYALDAPLALPGTPDGGAVRAALRRATVLGTAVLEGRYRRGG